MSHRSHRPLATASLMAAVAFLAFLAAAGLEPTGRDLLLTAVARAGLLAGLVAVVIAHPSIRSGRLGRAGVALAAVGTAAFAAGAASHVAIDGLAYNPFLVEGATPPWYSFVVGLGGFAFAAGAVLAGVAALREGLPRPLGVALLLGGATYLVAIPLEGLGHALWTAPWLALAGMLLAGPEARPAPSRRPAELLTP